MSQNYTLMHSMECQILAGYTSQDLYTIKCSDITRTEKFLYVLQEKKKPCNFCWPDILFLLAPNLEPNVPEGNGCWLPALILLFALYPRHITIYYLQLSASVQTSGYSESSLLIHNLIVRAVFCGEKCIDIKHWLANSKASVDVNEKHFYYSHLTSLVLSKIFSIMAGAGVSVI